MNLTRRLAFFLASILLSSGSGIASDLQKPILIETGLIEGVASDDAQLVTFKGIPYAAAPVGELRWREPMPAVKWDGIRRADQFGASCVQPKSSLLPPYTKEFVAFNPTSEDCLSLNLWTPAKSSADRLAVLFYIHGGSGIRGAGSVPIYDGEALARKGIIVITVNFRLGIFSGMGHPELTRESPHRSCGNYGMLDLIAALRWVRNNIAAFGGDPDKVTICGQSSGANAVHYLTTSPIAKRLFRGAIAISFPYDYLTKRHAIGNVWQKEQEGLKFVAAKNALTIDDLRKLSAEELIAEDPAVGAFTRSCLSGSPNIDGWAFIDKYPETLDKGLESDVPMLTGMTVDDFGPPVPFMNTTRANFGDALSSVFGQRSSEFEKYRDPFIRTLQASTDQQARESAKRIQIEYRLYDIYHWAKRRSLTSTTPVYTYLFEQAIPWPQHPSFGAFHSSDLVYWFNNLHQMERPWTEVDQRLADQASSYWVNFVKTGNPNGEGLPEWQPFVESQPITMSLGTTSSPREIAEGKRLEFYQYITKPNHE